MSPEEAEQAAAAWRSELALVERWQRRAKFEYVSKDELRQIALATTAALHHIISETLKRVEAEPESTIIAPLGAGQPQRSIVTL